MKFLLLLFISINFIHATVIDDYLNALKIEAKKENIDFTNFDKSRGEKIFTSKHIGKRGKEVSCVSCHTNDFTKKGENLFTGKIIEPLSINVNPKRLSKSKSITKWLRRNFNDVYQREGSALEKGDVLTYIINKE
mgnify:CR=1 FL=1